MFCFYYDEIPLERYREWKPDPRDRVVFMDAAMGDDEQTFFVDAYEEYNPEQVQELVASNILTLFLIESTAHGIQEFQDSRAQIGSFDSLTPDLLELIRENLTAV